MDEQRTDTTEESPGEPSPAEAGELASLREQVESQARRIDELARAYADALNERESFRKRLEREKDRQVEAARGEVAQGLLEAIDELRRALGSSEGPGLIDGVRLIADGLQRRAQAMGLEPIEAAGHLFDPLLHEAVDLVPVIDRDQDGMVVEEVRAGWRAGERVIRPARVRVARYVEAPQQQPS